MLLMAPRRAITLIFIALLMREISRLMAALWLRAADMPGVTICFRAQLMMIIIMLRL